MFPATIRQAVYSRYATVNGSKRSTSELTVHQGQRELAGGRAKDSLLDRKVDGHGGQKQERRRQ